MDHEIEYARRQADFAKPYRERLLDPRWQRLKNDALMKADYTCQECESKDRTLHVHHLWYRKNTLPWEYELDELRVLCDKCHEDAENYRQQIGKAIFNAPLWAQYDIVQHVLPLMNACPEVFWPQIVADCKDPMFQKLVGLIPFDDREDNAKPHST
jgi:hypothetical protein